MGSSHSSPQHQIQVLHRWVPFVPIAPIPPPTSTNPRDLIKHAAKYAVQKPMEQMTNNFVHSKGILPCVIKANSWVQNTFDTKGKIKEHVHSALEPKCSEYRQYKKIQENKTLEPFVKSYAESVLNDRNQQGTLPNFDSLTVDTLCRRPNDILPYVEDQKLKAAFTAICAIKQKPTIRTICDNREEVQSYLTPEQQKGLIAACQVYDTRTTDTICKVYPDVNTYLSDDQKKQLPTLCKFYSAKDTVAAICGNRDDVKPFLKSLNISQQELAAACNVHDKPDAETVCKNYPEVKPYLSDEQKNKISTLCDFVNVKNKVRWICDHRETVNPFLTSGQKSELKIGCGLYNLSFTKQIIEKQCKQHYNGCTDAMNEKDCCNMWITNTSVPLINNEIKELVQSYTGTINDKLNKQKGKIDALVREQVKSYTNQINNNLKKSLPEKMNKELHRHIKDHLPDIRDALQNEVNATVPSMVTQLKQGLDASNVALGKCFSFSFKKKSINNMCFELQNNFPQTVCKNDTECCINLLDSVCK